MPDIWASKSLVPSYPYFYSNFSLFGPGSLEGGAQCGAAALQGQQHVR
jgi:hypothetical protein